MSRIVNRDLGLADRLQGYFEFLASAVDLVGRRDIGENWPRHELKSLFLAIEDRHPDNIEREGRW